MSRHARFGVLLVASLLCYCRTLAMIEDLNLQFSRDDLFQIIWRFEFAEKGELSIDGQTMVNNMPTNSSVQLMVCSDSSLVKLRTIRIEDICATKPFDAAACEWSGMFNQDTSKFKVNLDIKSEDWYYLLQLNCDRLDFFVQAHIVAYNRGRYTGFLSLSEAPYVPLSVALAIVFTLLTLAQFLSWFPYRHFNIKFQSRLTLIPLFFAVFYTIQIYYWDYCSKHGIKSPLAFWSCFIILISTKSALFMLLLAVSKGWAICRRHLSSLDFKQSLLLVLGLVLAFSCFTVLGGMGLSTMILIYAMLLKVIFNSVVNILAEIDNQMQMLRSMSLDPNHFPIFVKRQIYHNFQLTALSYITLKVIFLLWANIFLQRFPWVSDMIDAFLDIAFLVCLFINFRMRPFCPRFAHVCRQDDSSRSELSRRLLRSQYLVEQDMEIGRSYEDIWRPGMAVPILSLDYDSWLHPYSEPLVLLQSPSSTDIGRQIVARTESKGGIR